MLIPCPHCGPRIHDEFTYLGDATPCRPEAGAEGAEAAYFEYVYVRDNPAGTHRELWFHAAGCHEWLVVERDTRTHAIFAARPARKTSLSSQVSS
jgi:methylglutamate dehydrogenase subunit B